MPDQYQKLLYRHSKYSLLKLTLTYDLFDLALLTVDRFFRCFSVPSWICSFSHDGPAGFSHKWCWTLTGRNISLLFRFSSWTDESFDISMKISLLTHRHRNFLCIICASLVYSMVMPSYSPDQLNFMALLCPLNIAYRGYWLE
jgi:hypothetical protein